VLARLYPRFHVADSVNWPAVWKKAKEGNPGELAVVNHGNDLLFGLHEKAEDLTQNIGDWKATADKIAQRLPAFGLAKKLLEQATGIEGMDAQASTLATIRTNRTLLDDPDPRSQGRREGAPHRLDECTRTLQLDLDRRAGQARCPSGLVGAGRN
jgi:hypothetical protein